MRLLALVLVAGCGGPTSSGKDAGAGDMAQPPDMAGTMRYAYPLAPFTLQGGEELINCYYVPPDGKEKFITRFDVDMKPGSHHLVVMRVKDDPMNRPPAGPTPCTQLDLPAGLDGLLPGSQRPPHAEYTLPDGVVMKLEKDHGLYFQSHYINAGKAPLTTDVTWTITTIDPSKAKEIAGLVFYSNFGLDIPPGMSQATMTCKAPIDMKFLLASGHMHKHGLTFDATLDGAPIYHTASWSEPDNREFPSPGMPVKTGQAISWTCAYNNDTGKPLAFGNSAATDEMCIFVSIYYPSAAGETLFKCNP